MSEIVSVPDRHVCDGLSGRTNGVWWYPHGDEPMRRYPEGTVRRCECGRTWVAGNLAGYMSSIWRREGWLERWLRERGERRARS